MRIVHDMAALKRVRRPLSIAAGFFDGLHRGHLKVIRSAVEEAQRRRGEAWVLTFDPHPMKVLNPAAAPALLTSLGHKLRLIGQMGVHGCVVLRFNRAFAAIAAEDFVHRLSDCAPALTHLFVGRNWRFGNRGRGTTALLAHLGRRLNFKAITIRPVTRTGETISSTRIRGEIQCGNLDEAAAMLGRRFSLLGTVVRGAQIGRVLGYPTANLDPHNEVLPPYGIYAVRSLIRNRWHDGVLSYGVRPTVAAEGAPSVLELHVLDYTGNLYGRNIEVEFVARIRDERRFESTEALSRQIGRDIEAARARLAETCR